LGYTGISEITDFDEKKIRNVLHRLHKTGKIQRKRRGLYVAVD
jgi:predicted transcriptional regulator of viral defense system